MAAQSIKNNMYNPFINMKKMSLIISTLILQILALRMIFLALAIPVFLQDTNEVLNLWKMIFVLSFGLTLGILSIYILLKKHQNIVIKLIILLLIIYLIVPFFPSATETPLQNYAYGLVIDNLWWVRTLHFLCALYIYKVLHIKEFTQ